jgi:hypothetical protein
MGTTPGHIAYACYMGAYDDINRIDRKVLDYTAKHFPQYLEAPDKWEDPSLSSLEWYARSQTPAPVAPGQSLSAPAPELPAWFRDVKARIAGDGSVAPPPRPPGT